MAARWKVKVDRSRRPRPRFTFTLVAMVIAAVLLILDRYNHPGTSLVANDYKSQQTAPGSSKIGGASSPGGNGLLHRLWKPQPDDLLPHATALGLSPTQQAGIRRIGSNWQRRKAVFESEMQGQSPPADTRVTSVESIRSGLGEYSRLSREYDEARRQAWQESMALLSKRQQQQAEGLLKPEGIER